MKNYRSYLQPADEKQILNQFADKYDKQYLSCLYVHFKRAYIFRKDEDTMTIFDIEKRKETVEFKLNEDEEVFIEYWSLSPNFNFLFISNGDYYFHNMITGKTTYCEEMRGQYCGLEPHNNKLTLYAEEGQYESEVSAECAGYELVDNSML